MDLQRADAKAGSKPGLKPGSKSGAKSDSDATANAGIAAGGTGGQRTTARALRLGGRLRLADLEAGDLDLGEVMAPSPLVLRQGGAGCAALFPYGTVVFIGVSRAAEEAFLQKLGDRIERPLATPVIVESQIEIGAGETASGDLITVRELSPRFLAVIADALAKNVALAFEEAEARKVFDVLEPLASDLASSGRLPRDRQRMLRTVGHALLIHRHLFEPVEVEERPDVLSSDGDIEQFHQCLADAHHFKKRAKALSRKIDAIEAMTTALTEMLDAQRGIRLETLIVLLIGIEMSIYLYDLFVRGG